MYSDKLIYGKNQTEKIVSIEVEDSSITIFKEDLPPEILPNRFWILSDSPLGRKPMRLKGNLHYKWGAQFEDRETFTKLRHIWKKQGKDVYSIYDPKEAAMVKDGITYFKGLKPSDVSILSFDIETTTLDPNTEGAEVLLISNTFRKNGKIIRRLFCYDEYNNAGEMIAAWCNWVREMNPSVIIGHNIYGFDLPYLESIAKQNDTHVRLGRNESNIFFSPTESKFRKDGSQFIIYHKPKVYGRELVDTMFLAIKYDIGRKYESYALKKIIAHEGLEVKDRQHYDASRIRYNYKDDVEWEKIKVYCIHDSDDALALFDLMVPPFFYLTQTIPKSFQSIIETASGSQINSVMLRSYLQDAHSIPKTSEENAYEGAISFGIPGIYNNVFKVDVASLYPSIILEWQVYDKEKDPKQYFLKLVSSFTERRLYHKKLAKTDKYHDDLQNSFKIWINSAYGFLATAGLNFNSPSNAAFITEKGRLILQDAIRWATGKYYG